MKGDYFGSNKVVAASELAWKDEGKKAVVCYELISAPLGCGIVITFFPDLEPAVSNPRIINGRLDVLHVDGARPLITRADHP